MPPGARRTTAAVAPSPLPTTNTNAAQQVVPPSGNTAAQPHHPSDKQLNGSAAGKAGQPVHSEDANKAVPNVSVTPVRLLCTVC